VAILTKQLPKVYVSQAAVLVKPRDVPENFVMDLTSASATQQHLRSIERMVLSRDNLLKIIEASGKDMPELRGLTTDERVERLTSQIKINFATEGDGRGGARVIWFTISYQNRDPVMAQRIAAELTDRFVQKDEEARRDNILGTTEFLSNELTKKEDELAESDTSLKSLKSRYLYELPQRLESNQRDLDRLTDSKRNNEETMARIISARLGYEQLIAQTDEFLIGPPKKTPAQAMKERDPNVDIFLRLKADYEQERATRREGHPNVDQAKARMDRAKALVPPEILEEVLNPKRDETAETTEEQKVKNPAYTHLQNQMRELEVEYKIRVNEKAVIEQAIAKVSRRVDNTPQVELEMTGIIRDNDDIRKERDQLNHDLTKAQLSQSLEEREQGSQFQVLDPANLPTGAEKPNKWAVLGAGCAFSLLLAIGFAFIVDLARQRVWTQSEIEAFWGVPVMVDIPAIVSDADQVELRRKRLTFATFFLAGFVVWGAFLYGVYLNNSYILQQLDPVLQTLVYR
jgi:polysaccharide chain length determinant protein (PEP-CTERM system associated)